MPEQGDLPAFLKPRLRLFLSADVIGSTALKQSRLGALQEYTDQGDTGPAWFSAIQGFYFVAAQAFMKAWEEEKEKSSDPENLYGTSPRIWKTIGDEILFVKLITDHRQIVIALQVWQRALQSIRDFLRGESFALGVKSTCWCAGFPFRNREVVVSRSEGDSPEIEDFYSESGRKLNKYYGDISKGKLSDIAVDFVGPSIDTGFRLSQFSSARKLIVSIDVAYFISMTQFDGELNRLDLFYDGSTNLKGVMGGNNYPLFWADVSDEKSIFKAEDKIRSFSSVEKENLKEYCECFYREHSGFAFRPFIDGDPGGVLSKRPDWYADYQQRLAANYEKEGERYSRGTKQSAITGGLLSEQVREAVLRKIREQRMEKGAEGE